MNFTEEQLNEFTQRFLQWKLPEDFNPDGGISFTRNLGNHTYTPVGTNLFTATQARKMIEHILGYKSIDLDRYRLWYGMSDCPVSDSTKVNVVLNDGVEHLNCFSREVSWNKTRLARVSDPSYVIAYEIVPSKLIVKLNTLYVTANYEVVGPFEALTGSLFREVTDKANSRLWDYDGKPVGVSLKEVSNNKNMLIAEAACHNSLSALYKEQE
jgi:hypothetical protein